jgi:hypothetical protein
METDNIPKQMRSHKQGVHTLPVPHIAVFGYALHIRQFMLSSGMVKYARIFTAAVAKILWLKAGQQLSAQLDLSGSSMMASWTQNNAGNNILCNSYLKIDYRHNVAGCFQPLARGANHER